MADQEFQRRDDVSTLLRLMNDFRDLLEDSSGQWPVKTMVSLLNERFPSPTWTDRRGLFFRAKQHLWFEISDGT
jgi:hypothetical protein